MVVVVVGRLRSGGGGEVGGGRGWKGSQRVPLWVHGRGNDEVGQDGGLSRVLGLHDGAHTVLAGEEEGQRLKGVRASGGGEDRETARDRPGATAPARAFSANSAQ